MTLTLQNQLKLLHDLLDEQLIYKTGDIYEFTQIKKLVQAIMTHKPIQDTDLFNYLPEIYHYGIEGEKIQCDKEHISSKEYDIIIWKRAIAKSSISSLIY